MLSSHIPSHYMASGLWIPSQFSTVVSSRSATASVASRNVFRAGFFFGEDMVLVIEVLELLGQLERVLGKIGRLRRGDALIEHQRSPRAPQPQRPDILRVLPCQKCSRLLPLYPG